MIRSRVLTAVGTVWLLAGCGTAPPGPEPIPLDRVNCARCGMLISNDANAAQSRVDGHPTRFFDDIGCLASEPAAQPDSTRRYVRLASGAWSTTEAAWFARSRTARTPMDYGFLAFATANEARAADREKQARQWPAIVALAQRR